MQNVGFLMTRYPIFLFDWSLCKRVNGLWSDQPVCFHSIVRSIVSVCRAGQFSLTILGLEIIKLFMLNLNEHDSTQLSIKLPAEEIRCVFDDI